MRRLLLILLGFGGWAQAQVTYCNIKQFTLIIGSTSTPYNNTGNQCSNWTFTYYTQAASGGGLTVQIEIDGAPDNGHGAPGTFAIMPCAPSAGVNPMTFNPGAGGGTEGNGSVVFTNCYAPWIRVSTSGFAGNAFIRAYGSAGITAKIGGGGGGGGTITGSGAAGQCTSWSGISSITGTGNCTIDGAGNLVVASSVSAGAAPAVTGAGIVGIGESTGQACAVGADCIVADSATHRALLVNNNVAMGAVLGASSNDTLTGKSFDTGGGGNVLKLSGLQVITAQGTSSKVQMANGTVTGGHCGQFDVGGNLVDAGIACGGGSGGFPVYQSGAASATTSSTTEVNLATSAAIPAGTLTANSSITVFPTYRFVGSAGAKTPTIRLSTVAGQVGAGTASTAIPFYSAATASSATSFTTVTQVQNANAVNSQFSAPGGFGGTATATSFSTIDTSANAVFVNFNCTVANASDTCQLLGYKIFIN